MEPVCYTRATDNSAEADRKDGGSQCSSLYEQFTSGHVRKKVQTVGLEAT